MDARRLGRSWYKGDEYLGANAVEVEARLAAQEDRRCDEAIS